MRTSIYPAPLVLDRYSNRVSIRKWPGLLLDVVLACFLKFSGYYSEIRKYTKLDYINTYFPDLTNL